MPEIIAKWKAYALHRCVNKDRNRLLSGYKSSFTSVTSGQHLFQIEDFGLHVVHPLIFHQEFGNSSNKPVLVTCFDTTAKKKDDFVIKLLDGERMNSDAFMKECLASLMALALGLATPLPAVADVTEEFIVSRKGYDDFIRFQKSKGSNFATKKFPNIRLVNAQVINRHDFRADALKIFAFDLLIQNPDRTTINGKPNLFTDDAQLVILDHELAFTFLVPIFGRPRLKPWEFGQFDLHWVTSHVLYPSLKGKQLNFSELQGFLSPLTPQFWHEIRRIIPVEWINDSDLQRIEDHISAVRDHEKDFILQIQNLLK